MSWKKIEEMWSVEVKSTDLKSGSMYILCCWVFHQKVTFAGQETLESDTELRGSSSGQTDAWTVGLQHINHNRGGGQKG